MTARIPTSADRAAVVATLAALGGVAFLAVYFGVPKRIVAVDSPHRQA